MAAFTDAYSATETAGFTDNESDDDWRQSSNRDGRKPLLSPTGGGARQFRMEGHVNESFAHQFRRRAGVLVALLAFQSCSSFILASFETLLQKHTVVVFFLTMLVGAGGNAGNQAAVLVIRGLATGLLGECRMALAIAVPMVAAGYVRVIAFHGTHTDALAITTSLLVIVVSSVIFGTLLPLLLHHCGLDAAHAGATIQVIMDLAGVCITCTVCSLMLP
jgi:Mg/Co/Ni transporter MgtE